MKITQPFKIRSNGETFKRGISLRTQIFFGLGILGGILVFIGLAIFNHALTTSLRAIQDQLSVQRVERMMLQASMFAKTHIAHAKDNTEWDDAFEYLEGRLPNFLTYNYASPDPAIGNQLVLAIDRNKKLIGRQAGATAAGAKQFEGIDIEKFIHSALLSDVGIGGFVLGDDGSVFMVAAHPVKRSDRTGPSPGWLVFVKNIDLEQLMMISELTGVPVSLAPSGAVGHPEPSDHLMELSSKLLGAVWAIIPKVVEQPEGDHSSAKAAVYFKCIVTGNDVGFFVDLPSRMFATAYELERTIRSMAIFGLIILLMVCFIGFEILVVRRVLALDADLQAVVDSRNENLRVRVMGQDEIARVADTSNRMLDALASEHRTLITEHNLLESVLHSVGDGVLALTPVKENGSTVDFQIATSNVAAAKYFGKSPDQLPGVRLSELRDLGDPAVCISHCDTVLQTGKAQTREILYSEKSDKWVRQSMTSWADGVVLSFEDISARKRNERALSDSLDELTRLTSAMMGREERILELKKEINALCTQLQRPPIYASAGITI